MNDLSNSNLIPGEHAPPKLSLQSTRRLIWIAVALFAGVGAGVVLFCFDPAKSRFFPFCFFHLATGLQCPGCGGTRALHQLLRGHVAAALHLNALLVVSLPMIGWQVISVAAGKIRQVPKVPYLSVHWLWLFLVLAVVFGVLRNLPAFSWLSP